MSKMMDAAKMAAKRSDDPDTQVGVALVLRDGELMCDANRAPAGVSLFGDRKQRPKKYDFIEHAERSVLFRAAQIGRSAVGSTMYLPWFPCPECARTLVGFGVTKLVCYKPTAEQYVDPKWRFENAHLILLEGGVTVEYEDRGVE